MVRLVLLTAEYLSPCGPVGPVAPVDPAPVGPDGPVGPVGPVAPTMGGTQDLAPDVVLDNR